MSGQGIFVGVVTSAISGTTAHYGAYSNARIKYHCIYMLYDYDYIRL